jgi:hypothetical protein
MDIKMVSGARGGGHFEIVFPRKFAEDAGGHFEIRWIDFYR